MIEEIRSPRHLIGPTSEELVFLLNVSVNFLRNWAASSPVATLVLKTSRVKLVFSIWRTYPLYSVFSFLSFCFKTIFWGLSTWLGQLSWVILSSRKDFCWGRQKLRHDTPSLVFSFEVAVRERRSPDLKGIRAGSIATSLHTFGHNLASRFHIPLCLTITNLLSWHVIAWSLLFSIPHSRRRGRFLTPHP